MMDKFITILGLGNLLLKDDGIGIRVVQELQKETLPPGVQAVEGVGSFINYWDIFAHSTHIIAADAMDGGGRPGTVYLLDAHQVDHQEKALFSHEDNIFSVMNIMGRFGLKPQVWIIGIQPKEISYSLELSTEISDRMPKILNLVRRQAMMCRGCGNVQEVIWKINIPDGQSP